jgi:hypothetical protein
MKNNAKNAYSAFTLSDLLNFFNTDVALLIAVDRPAVCQQFLNYTDNCNLPAGQWLSQFYHILWI